MVVVLGVVTTAAGAGVVVVDRVVDVARTGVVLALRRRGRHARHGVRRWIGGVGPRSLFTAPDLASADGVVPLRLVHLEKVWEDLVWLSYEVER